MTIEKSKGISPKHLTNTSCLLSSAEENPCPKDGNKGVSGADLLTKKLRDYSISR
jgi:hypothetical protein